jgi:hypothetical protein
MPENFLSEQEVLCTMESVSRLTVSSNAKYGDIFNGALEIVNFLFLTFSYNGASTAMTQFRIYTTANLQTLIVSGLIN